MKEDGSKGINGDNGYKGYNEDDGDSPETFLIDEISRPAQMTALPELMEFVSAIERKEGFGDQRIGEIEAALREAFTNIVKSAEKKKEGSSIKVTCKHDHWGKFIITIEDTAEPFNILLADVVFMGEESPVDVGRRDSARLIKRMIDNIEQKRVDETNVLTFTVAPAPRTKH